ncbi:GNAT family N-acetyltransferase [Ktedonospora formicarum]|uniref:N-acetyltransferase domain-containing protein n=1 Tax=Ktedonospora formicarum TaxID=2778364 RepID=A0A8J3I2G5_9CHLR|nr:GNAT family N-acetyltransferase [Ktedonospora formicarum]GHO46381.1 hypothetical protein KSX_45440 [Ktedonospora formicarum]
MSSVTFQLATPTDLETIIFFMQQFYAMYSYQLSERKREVVDHLLRTPAYGRIWLIQYNQQPVGYVILTFGYSIEFYGRDALVDELYISDDARGKKVGTQTLAFLEKACQEMGIRALHLEVEYDNEVGQHLYRKAGFAEHKRHFMTRWLPA